MSQISFVDAEYAGKRKKMRREVFLDEMEVVVPWKALLGLIEPPYPVGDRGRRPYPPASMLRVHLMQNWFPLSDPAMGSGTAVPGLALRKANVCLDAGLFSDGRLPRAKAYLRARYCATRADATRRAQSQLPRKRRDRRGKLRRQLKRRVRLALAHDLLRP